MLCKRAPLGNSRLSKNGFVIPPCEGGTSDPSGRPHFGVGSGFTPEKAFRPCGFFQTPAPPGSRSHRGRESRPPPEPAPMVAVKEFNLSFTLLYYTPLYSTLQSSLLYSTLQISVPYPCTLATCHPLMRNRWQ